MSRRKPFRKYYFHDPNNIISEPIDVVATDPAEDYSWRDDDLLQKTRKKIVKLDDAQRKEYISRANKKLIKKGSKHGQVRDLTDKYRGLSWEEYCAIK